MVLAADRVKNSNIRKRYVHFDHRVSFDDVKHLVVDPDYIIKHSFYLFIHRKAPKHRPPKHGEKWSKLSTGGKRDISYPSHIDRCIHQYYAVLLNDRYNMLSNKLGIHDSVVAYRTNIGQTNIQVARRAFDYMVGHEECSVFVTDLEKFFDNVDHRYMKIQVRRLFDDGAIPDDYYAALKHVLRFRVWDLEDLHKLNGLPFSKTGTKRLSTHDRVLPIQEFRALAPRYVKRLFEPGVGMPQGSPLSGVLANVYLLELDTKMRECADACGVLYLRYSDDILFAAPDQTRFDSMRSCFVRALGATPRVEIGRDKTHEYRFIHGVVHEYRSAEGLWVPSKIEHLGFAFDGKTVSVKSGTLGRYYNGMCKKVRKVFRWRRNPGKKRVRELYRKVSAKGAHSKYGSSRRKLNLRGGNFLTYVDRAQCVFLDQPIAKGVDGHMGKIRRESKRLRSRRDKNR